MSLLPRRGYFENKGEFMSGIHVKFDVTPEVFLSHLTEAAYRVALKHGFAAPFIEVELEMHQALREIIRRDMQVSPVCGAPVCHRAEQHEPWSPAAADLLPSDKF